MIEIKEQYLYLIQQILSKFVPSYEVWAFGSRVTGKAGLFSDLDIVIYSDLALDKREMALLRQEFSESDLPIKVDVLQWSQLNVFFRESIRQSHEILKEAHYA